MATKWMNAMVVLVFVLLLIANKGHFISEVKEKTVEPLNDRTEATETYIEREPLKVRSSDVKNETKKSVKDVNEGTTATETEDASSDEAEKDVIKEIEPKPVEDNKVETELKTSKKEKQIVYNLQVEPGMGSKQVADHLFNAKIISEKRAFNDYLMKYGYAKKIQIGDYKIRDTMSFEGIARLITSK